MCDIKVVIGQFRRFSGIEIDGTRSISIGMRRIKYSPDTHLKIYFHLTKGLNFTKAQRHPLNSPMSNASKEANNVPLPLDNKF